MNAADSPLVRSLAYVRAHGLKAGLEVAVNFGLTFAVYDLSSPSLGPVKAMMLASAPPILWSLAMLIRERKLDAISLVVLSGIMLSLLAFAGGGGVKVLQLRETLVAGLVGLVFLGSAALGRPLIYELSRAGSRRRGKDAAAAIEALGDDPRFRHAMLVATLVWGFGLVAVCAVSCALVFVVSIKEYLLIGGPIGYAKLGLLTAWTFWYVPREVRQALARRAPPGEPIGR